MFFERNHPKKVFQLQGSKFSVVRLLVMNGRRADIRSKQDDGS
jgi:hypothetical protein